MHDYDDEGPNRSRGALRMLCVLAVGVAGGFAIRPLLASDDEPSASGSIVAVEAASTTGVSASTNAPETTAANAAEPTATTDAAEPTEPTPTTEVGSDAVDTTEAVDTTDPSPTTEAPEATWAPMPPSDPAVTTSFAPATVPVDSTEPVSQIPYDTMPDGSPEPVVVTFGPDVITLTGAVPSAEASAFLSGYAAANSQTPGLPIDNRLVVNESVPIGVGVRVIELESPRFADGSAEIGAAHARQLDRVAGVMQTLPHLTVVVVGHADQRGDDATNLDLSQERADSVIAYLADRGVEGSRMSARAVGEADLLSTSDDVESLTLNRRTEFIFYGVLLTDPAALGLA